MLIITTETVPGREIDQALGMVKGSTIRAKNIGKDIIASFRNLVGGEMKEYAQMLNESRQIATQDMVKEAKALDADAIVNVRYTTSSVMQGAAEILVYGTAVKLK